MPPAHFRSEPLDVTFVAPDAAAEVVLVRAPVALGTLVARVFDSTTGAEVTPSLARLHPLDGAPARPAPRVRLSGGHVHARAIPAGRWGLAIDVAGRTLAMRKVTILNDGTRVELDIDASPRAPGRIVGRVSFGELSRPDPVRVSVLRAAPSAARSGLELVRSAEVEADGTFVLEDFEPGALRIALRGRLLGGTLDVEIGPGEAVTVEMVAEPASELRFAGAALVPSASVTLSYERVGGEEPHLASYGIPRAATDTDWMQVTVTPGTYRWRARFHLTADQPVPPCDQEGTIEVASGESLWIEIPIEPRE